MRLVTYESKEQWRAGALVDDKVIDSSTQLHKPLAWQALPKSQTVPSSSGLLNDHRGNKT